MTLPTRKPALFRALAGAALAMLMATPQAALAQDGGAAADAAPASPEMNWAKVCKTLDSGERACVIRQLVVNGGLYVGSFELHTNSSSPTQYLVSAGLPLGVLVPFQMTFTIDSDRPRRVPYMLCDTTACYAQTGADDAFIASLKRGASLTLTGKVNRGDGIADFTVNFDLHGFTAVMESDGVEVAETPQTGDNTALEQMLQDRAEQLRQQLGVPADGATDPNANTDPAPSN
ncbi:MAG: invasion associated locus B family protein [Hyphomicrobiaceae bacterium]|nr:invasion associated locus B family protein [Hyphomicrobiaceae bacterium]